MSQARLEHAYLSVKDLERSLSFYRRILPDWVIRWEGRGEGGRWIHFGPPGDDQPGYLSLAERPDAGSFEPYSLLGPQHIGFAHPDVDRLIAEVKPGIQPDDYVDDGKYRRVYYSDPDGIELEFVQKL
jgi:catechol 2,3-dioxygenase-like lactoylglutathione lyase family enzyme